jgi:hypothetical protein
MARAPIFGDDEPEGDIEHLEPEPKTADPEELRRLRQVGANLGYVKAEETPPPPVAPPPAQPVGKVQLNLRCDASLKARFDAIAKANEWRQESVFRRAVEALERDMGIAPPKE